MQNDHRNPKLAMSDGLYRFDHPDSDIFLPRPVRPTSIRTLGDYIGYLRKNDEQSNKPCFACEPNQSEQSDCASSCDCSGAHHAKCDEQSGSESSAKSNDGFADNLQYTNNTSTSSDKAKVRGYPCVVVGADCEARDEAESKSVPFSEH